jgi:hypothetical protein
MADHDPAAELILLGQFEDAADIHMLGAVADIEMQVEIDIIFAREREDAIDLRRRVAVLARRGAEHWCSRL